MSDDVMSKPNLNIIQFPKKPVSGEVFARALLTIVNVLLDDLQKNDPFFSLLFLMLGGHISEIDIGTMDPKLPTTDLRTDINEITLLDLQILTNQAEGHSALAPAEKPDKENLKKPNVDSHGPGQQATGAKKHPAIDSNQFRGVNPDGHQPSSPEEMTPDEINSAASELQLTPGQELTHRLGNEAKPTPAATPTPSPYKS